MSITDLSKYRQTSYRDRLRDLYRRIDNADMTDGFTPDQKQEFAYKVRGEFLGILRIKKCMSTVDAAKYLRISPLELEDIESGRRRLDQPVFFRLASYLGGNNDVSVLLEKIEKALVPGLRKARRNYAQQSWIYGIRFADDAPEKDSE